MSRWLRPDLFLDHVTDLTPELLRARGWRGVILDADNTVVPRSRYQLDERTAGWLHALTAAGVRLCILSNSAHFRQVAAMAEPHGMAAIAFARKPFASGFRRALRALGTTPAETVMVGDQLFTDILGGNLAGLTTVMVPPLTGDDFIGYRLLRPVERRLLRRWTPAGSEPHA